MHCDECGGDSTSDHQWFCETGNQKVRCTGPCGAMKNRWKFPKNSTKKQGHDSECKVCKATRQRNRYAEGPGYFYDLQRRYGISETAYKDLLFKQKNACAICKDPFGDEKPRVDHNHETMEVRGLLCHGCNTGIGLFKENPKSLLEAMKYLATHNNALKRKAA